MGVLCLVKVSVLFCILSVSKGQLPIKSGFHTDGIVDAKIVQEKWKQMESGMENAIKGAMNMLLPNLMDGSSSLNISSACIKDVWKIITGLRQMKIWAFKFLDATSKSVDGLLDGTIASLGNYDECINNQVIQQSGKNKGKVLFTGKYCSVRAKPYLPPKPKTVRVNSILEALRNFTEKDTVIGYNARTAHLTYYGTLKLGLCVPSTCSEDDINQVLGKASDATAMFIYTPRCEVKEDVKFTPGMIAVISLYSFTGFLVLIASLITVYSRYRKTEFKGTAFRILTSFSFISNFEKLIDTSKSDNFSCLNGIKALTMCWIILGHTYLSFMSTILKGGNNVLAYSQEFVFQGVIHGSLAVNTFFFVTGTLLCYNFTKSIIIGKGTFNGPMYALHRIWRILPLYAYVIAFFILLPLIGSGPIYYEVMNPLTKSCEKNWWANLLFITNYYNVDDRCAPHSWYLTLDMQFYFGALIILLPLKRWPKIGIAICVAITIASMIGSWINIYMHDFPPYHMFSPDPSFTVDFTNRHFIQVPAHAGSYCIGILCGYFLAMYPKFRIPKVLQVFGWCSSATVCVLVVNGVQKWNSGVVPTFWETFFYSSCFRVAWTLGMAWVLICCSTGHGGIVNYILSWKALIPLGRLTLPLYLIHPLVMYAFAASTRTEHRLEHRTIIWAFLGNLTATIILSVGGSMLVEAPFLSLEKIALSGGKKKVPPDVSKENHQTVQESSFLEKNDIIEVCNGNEKVLEANNGFDNKAFVQRL